MHGEMSVLLDFNIWPGGPLIHDNAELNQAIKLIYPLTLWNFLLPWARTSADNVPDIRF